MSKLSVLNLAFVATWRFNCIRIATMAAAHPYARGGHTGAIRCTQRHQPSQPPVICANSADCSLIPA